MEQKPRILVVEDETIVAMDLERSLRDLGYEVVDTTGSGESAIKLAEHHRPDLVLMDIRLQGVLDGIQAGQAIRENLGLPIVFLTAHADASTVERAKAAEPYGYLLKPFEHQELHTAIEIALNKRAAEETLLRTAGEALRQSEERFKLLVESLRDYGICLLDPAGRIVSWNPGAQRIHGFSEHEIFGKHLSVFYRPEEVVRNTPDLLLKAAARDGQAREEGWLLKRDGARFWSEVLITALRDKNGNLVGFAKITRDISERRRAEEEIRKLNASLEQKVSERTAELNAANQELEAFTYTVAHDLRGPLRGIHSFFSLIDEQIACGETHELPDFVEKGTSCAVRMNKLIDDLLSLSRVSRQEIRFSPLDLNAVLRDALGDLQAEIGSRMVDWQIEKLPDATGDPSLLRQVFVNLLANALKYTGRREKAVIRVGSTRQGGDTVFHVADNGVGFDMNHQSRLFQPFSRLHSATEFPGTGVGLATIERIIRRHAGRIWAEGRPDHGATFYFTLGHVWVRSGESAEVTELFSDPHASDDYK